MCAPRTRALQPASCPAPCAQQQDHWCASSTHRAPGHNYTTHAFSLRMPVRYLAAWWPLGRPACTCSASPLAMPIVEEWSCRRPAPAAARCPHATWVSLSLNSPGRDSSHWSATHRSMLRSVSGSDDGRCCAAQLCAASTQDAERPWNGTSLPCNCIAMRAVQACIGAFCWVLLTSAAEHCGSRRFPTS